MMKFSKNDKMNTKFLPNIDFKDIWKEDLGDRTQNYYLEIFTINII